MKSKSTSVPKRILKTLLVLILILILVLAGYVAYAFIYYDRLPDNLELKVKGDHSSEVLEVSEDKSYHLTDWNIGFGAYTDQFSFFMDGGDYSRAFSKEADIENINEIIDVLKSYNSDIYLIQEVDFDAA